jgi:dephospho-CoA kinase
VLRTVRGWWGDDAFQPDGRIDRRAIARRVFGSSEERRRLERLIHPVVARLRDERMAEAARLAPPARPVAIVWDTPLLFEAGLAGRCDAVVFVDATRADRLRRVRDTRGWDEAELDRRENSQWPLDKKRTMSHHVLTNTGQPATPARDSENPVQAADVTPATTDGVRPQVRLILSRILAATNGTNQGAGLD